MHIAVVGGGIAGLYAALALQDQGHQVTIYESNSRLGGRIYTHRFKPQRKGDDPFFEAGAMRLRLSSFHLSLFDLVRYLNGRCSTEDKIKLLPFVLQHPNNKLLIGGRFRKCGDTTLAADLGLPPRYHNKSAAEILLEVMQPWIDLIWNEPDRGVEEVLRYDELSFRHFLRHVALMPPEVIDFVELIQSQTSQYDNGFVDLTIQTMHFHTPEWVTVSGGLSTIIDRAADVVGRNNIHLNSRVLALEEKATRASLHIGGFREYDMLFDKVLFAIPPSAIQRLRARPTWSPLKEQAIRSAHEGPLYKMGIHFRRRFWESLSEPSFGGQDQTDLRIRWVVYPSQEIGSENSGCVVAYCGMTDALRWGWMEKAERLKLILEDLNAVFEPRGVNVYEEYLDYFDARWPSEHTFSNTMYYPGQYTRFHKAMAEPEGYAYFAGEHISIHHTWIAGSVDSSHEAVKKILADPALPRLGDTSHLHIGPVRLGWDVAAGIPLASSNPPSPPSLASTPQDSKAMLGFKDVVDAPPQAKLISAFVNDIKKIASGPANDTIVNKLDTPTLVAG